ncbi:hypothetical protein PSHT_16080 [Puccinia striiformis]|uniref:Uncharacterized protein n=1 Tax=Puccinia striiformis TaxID=27350 RepID=A0A2S4UBL4_9BASI|nr:hypothetical protein PSHT_16080 [Puccinia striiformis]
MGNRRGDEEHQVDSCVVLPATIDRSEQLDISPALRHRPPLRYPDSERKNLRTQFPSEPSSSYPLPVPTGTPYFDQGTDRRSIKSKKPLKSRNVDDKGKENIPIAATHRRRTGTRAGTILLPIPLRPQFVEVPCEFNSIQFHFLLLRGQSSTTPIPLAYETQL